MTKIIIFTIKKYELWEELWEKIKQNMLDLHAKGIIITAKKEIGNDQFGEFFKHRDGGNLDALYLLTGNIKVFFVKQCGEYEKDKQGNTGQVIAILKSYATCNDELFVAQHESGGMIDWANDGLKRFLADKSIKHQLVTFKHEPSCPTISKTRTWLESGMMSELDELLNLFEEKPSLHAFKILSYFFPLHLELQLENNDEKCKEMAEEILKFKSDIQERMEKINELINKSHERYKDKIPDYMNSIYKSANEKLDSLLSHCGLISKARNVESIPKSMSFDDFNNHYEDLKNNFLKITYTLREIESS